MVGGYKMLTLLQIISRMIAFEYSKEDIEDILINNDHTADDIYELLDVEPPFLSMDLRFREMLLNKDKVKSAINVSFLKAGLL